MLQELFHYFRHTYKIWAKWVQSFPPNYSSNIWNINALSSNALQLKGTSGDVLHVPSQVCVVIKWFSHLTSIHISFVLTANLQKSSSKKESRESFENFGRSSEMVVVRQSGGYEKPSETLEKSHGKEMFGSCYSEFKLFLNLARCILYLISWKLILLQLGTLLINK